jgi:ferritin-like metal-binding protein YciE
VTNLKHEIMKSKTQELIEWLRDAYAMEISMEQMLKRISEDDKATAAVRDVTRTHMEETVRHSASVERCLQMLGADTSNLKTGVATAGEFIKDTLASFASDKRVKDLLSSYAAEHFEIACYTAIRVAAQSVGEIQIVAICDSIIDDEKRTAKRLQECVPDAVSVYLSEASR